MIKKLITLGLSLFTFIATMTPIYAVDNSASVDISGEYGIVIDQDNGQILYNKKAKEKMYPASITKVMTALLTLEHGNMDDEQPDSADGEAYTDPDMEEGSEDDSSDDSIDPNEELVPIDEAPGMSAGEDVEGIE